MNVYICTRWGGYSKETDEISTATGNDWREPDRLPMLMSGSSPIRRLVEPRKRDIYGGDQRDILPPPRRIVKLLPCCYAIKRTYARRS